MCVTSAKLSFDLQHVSVGYPEHTVLNRISLQIPKGKLTTIIGPNGCGKSTLLKCLSRLLPQSSGKLLFNDAPLGSYSRKEFAKILTTLPQHLTAPRGTTVFDLVARGRTPYKSLLSQWTTLDQQAVDQAIEQVSLSEHAGAMVQQLSGGQRQRAWIAMTLAQQTQTILLDEPTASLDPRHQIDVFSLLQKLSQDQGKTVLVVVHDLNMALHYADFVVVLRDGQLITADTTGNALTPKVIQEAFDLQCEIVKAKQSGNYAIVPFSTSFNGT